MPPKKQPKAPAPALMETMTEMAGMGMETVGARDLLIPRIAIANHLSPVLKKSNPSYIPGAKEGDICDTGLGRNFESINFLPVSYRKYWIEWYPRKTGKGIVAMHTSDTILSDCHINSQGEQETIQGNIVVETAQFYGYLLVAGEKPMPVFISMSGSQLRKARQLNTLAASEEIKLKDGSVITPPLCYRTYSLSSIEESNDQGEWFGWVVERGVTLEEWCGANKRDPVQQFQEAKKLNDLVTDQVAQHSLQASETTGTAITSGEEEAM